MRWLGEIRFVLGVMCVVLGGVCWRRDSQKKTNKSCATDII